MHPPRDAAVCFLFMIEFTVFLLDLEKWLLCQELHVADKLLRAILDLYEAHSVNLCFPSAFYLFS